jgi:hypothetical protein
MMSNSPMIIAARKRHIQQQIEAVKSVEFLSEWPSGRPFKHGAMTIIFKFPVWHKEDAISVVKNYLSSFDLTQSVDYHIPAWNWGNRNMFDGVRDLIVTFDSDEVFVMTKMGWDMLNGAEDDI